MPSTIKNYPFSPELLYSIVPHRRGTSEEFSGVEGETTFRVEEKINLMDEETSPLTRSFRPIPLIILDNHLHALLLRFHNHVRRVYNDCVLIR